jgi:hypothetical protein
MILLESTALVSLRGRVSRGRRMARAGQAVQGSDPRELQKSQLY